MKTIVMCIIILVTLISCIEERNKIVIIDDETFLADDENENLKLAVLKAQKNLNYFIKNLKEHSSDTAYWFSAKTKFENRESIDHIWFKTIAFNSNDSFVGVLHNEPDWSDTLKIDDTIYIHKKDIEDWYIEHNKSIEGDFTEKILFPED